MKKKIIIKKKYIFYSIGILLFFIITFVLFYFLFLPLNPEYKLLILNKIDNGNRIYLSTSNKIIQVKINYKEPIIGFKNENNFSIELEINNEDSKEYSINKNENKDLEILVNNYEEGEYNLNFKLKDSLDKKIFNERNLILVIDNTNPLIKEVKDLESNQINFLKEEINEEINYKVFLNIKSQRLDLIFSERAIFSIKGLNEEEYITEDDFKENINFDYELIDENSESIEKDYKLIDLAGNLSSGKIEIIYDDKCPVIEVISSTEISTLEKDDYVLLLSVDELVTGVKLGEKEGNLNQELGYYEFTEIGLIEGENNFKAEAYDLAGNYGEKSFTIKIIEPKKNNQTTINIPSNCSEYCYSKAIEACGYGYYVPNCIEFICEQCSSRGL